MGYTMELYKSLLFKELFGNDYQNKLKTGDIPPVDDNRMQEAIKIVFQKLDKIGPNLKNTKKAFNRFVRSSRDQDLYEDFGYDKSSADKYSKGHTVKQFKKNREAFMKMAVEPLVRQEIEWVRAAKGIGLSEDKLSTFLHHQDRWTRNLMHTDGTEESRKHNERVVALFALCYKDITEDKFKEVRRKHNNNPEDNVLLDDEIKNAAKCILDITKKELEGIQEDADKLPGIVSDIFSGNTNKPERGQSLESCYKAMGSRKFYLSWVSADVAALLKKLGLPDEQNFTQDEILRWQDLGGKTSYQALGELAANPYYTFVNPYKVYENADGHMPRPLDDMAPEEALRDGFLSNADKMYGTVASVLLEGQLGKYAIKNNSENFDERVGNFRIYQQSDLDEDGKNIERTVILKVQDLANGEPICVTETRPEDIFNDGLEKERNALKRRIDKWSKKNRTSKQFEGMRDALNAFNEIKLVGEIDRETGALKNVSLKLYRTMQEKLDELEKAVDVYLNQKKADKDRRGGYKSSYEKERVEYAKKLKEFTERKKKELGFAKKFTETRQLYKQTELDMAKSIKNENDKRYKKLSGLAYMIEKAKNVRESAKKARQEAAQRERQKQKEIKEEQEKKDNTVRGRKYRKQLDDIKKKVGDQPLNKDDTRAKNKVNAYVDERKRGYDAAAGDPKKACTEAKKCLAAMAIEKYLELESRQKKEPKDWSIHELINAGKIVELTDFVMNTDYFNDNFVNEEKLLNKEGFKSHINDQFRCFNSSKHIMTCMELANEADKSKEHQVENVEKVRNNEEIKQNLKETGVEANNIEESRKSVRELLNINQLIEAEQKENGKLGTGRKRSNSVTIAARKNAIENAKKNANEAENKQKAPEPLGGKGIVPKRKSRNSHE